MKMSLSKWCLLVAMVLPLCLASCGVTETPNPCPGPQCPAYAPDGQPTAEDASSYVNDDFGVLISVPSGWSYEESLDGRSVTFRTDALPETSATFFFEIVDPAPESLFAYLTEEYPGRTFLLFSTQTLTGYFFDDPAIGVNGGDAREYFLLDVDLVVRIEAEIFSTTKSEFLELLEGVSFFT